MDNVLLHIDLDKLLTKRQAQVVRMRFFDRATFAEIGCAISTSGYHAQRICEKSLKKLKKYVQK